ncbi:GDP-L-galactose phosphorylase 1-like [Hordeum vulgare]|nr:GDP-L-galactose phosphorylase 1-like [Hordeum vulgare]
MLSPPSPNLDKIDMIHRISGDTRLQLLVGHAGSTDELLVGHVGSTDELLFNVNPTDLLSLAEFATITVKLEEVIFKFQETENDSAQYFDGAPPTVSASPSSILNNVRPIGYCHVLLIPQVQEYLLQRVDQESFLLAMYVTKEARNSFFRVRYNSLGALATINHLHFQVSHTQTSLIIACEAYYLKVQYPVEKAPTEELTVVGNGVSISQLVQYPVSGFVFEEGAGLEDLSQVVSNACIFLQENNRPFNVLISESAKRVFLPLQELSGHLVLKRRKDYDEASEATLCRFLVEASLSGAEFQELKR